MSFEAGKDREEKIDKFLDALTWFHSEKTTPTGFFSTIGRIDTKLGELNQNIKEANQSSEKLTSALNKITLAGVIVASLALIVATGNLVVEVLKYAKGIN